MSDETAIMIYTGVKFFVMMSFPAYVICSLIFTTGFLLKHFIQRLRGR